MFFLKNVLDLFPEHFEFLKGVYEFRSDRPAIELLVGDRCLLDYLHGKIADEVIWEYLQEQEKSWFSLVKEFRY